MEKPTFVYVTYIATTLEQLWEALTSESFAQQYWGDGQLQSDWQVGASVQHLNSEGEIDWQGEVVQADPPYRLAYTVQSPEALLDEPPSRVRIELEPQADRVKLTLIHDRQEVQSCLTASQQWPIALSTLKRRLETEPLETDQQWPLAVPLVA